MTELEQKIKDYSFKDTYKKLHNFPKTVGVMYDELPFGFQLHIKHFERVNPEYEYDKLQWSYNEDKNVWTVSILYKHRMIR